MVEFSSETEGTYNNAGSSTYLYKGGSLIELQPKGSDFTH